MANIQVGKISGTKSNLAICGIFNKRISLADSTEGTLVSCLLIRSESKVDLPKALSDIFEIAEKKLEGVESGILDALKSVVLVCKNYDPKLRVNFVHTFFYEDVCYIVRLGKDVKLMVFDPPKSTKVDFESGSGPTSAGQIYILATEAFFAIFDTSVFVKDAEVDFEGIIDEIATEIAGEENQAEIGAALVQVLGDVPEVSKVSSSFTTSFAKATEVKKVSEDKKESEAENVEENREIGEVGESVNQWVSGPEDQKVGESEILETAEPETPLRPAKPDYEGQAPLRSSSFEGQGESLIQRIRGKIANEFSKIRHGDIGVIRKNIVLIAVLVVLILAFSVGFAVYKNNNAQKLAEFEAHYSAASSKYSEASAIIELNKVRARDILVEADGEVKLALAVLPKEERGKKLAEDIVSLLKKTEVSSNVEFTEVAKLDDNLKSLGQNGGSLVGISSGKLFEVDLASLDVTDLDGISATETGFVWDNKAFVFAGGTISRLDLVDGKSIEVGKANGVLDLWVFSGNVYALLANSIAKFVPIEGGYSQSSEYLNNPESFGAKSRLSIDGSVWVTKGTEIFKYTRGEREDFKIEGLVGSPGEFSLLYTDANLDNLYVVDSTNSALLVIAKDGLYQKVLQSPEFANAVDIVVSEDEETLYMAVGPKILKTNL